MGGAMTVKGFTIHEIDHLYVKHYEKHRCMDEVRDIKTFTSLDNGIISTGKYLPNEGVVEMTEM